MGTNIQFSKHLASKVLTVFLESRDPNTLLTNRTRHFTQIQHNGIRSVTEHEPLSHDARVVGSPVFSLVHSTVMRT